MVEIWVPVTMFTAMAVILTVYFYFRFRTRKEMQGTIRTALEKETNVTPEFMDQLRDSLVPVRSDLRRGILSIAGGIALVAFAYMLNEDEATQILMGLAAFPFVIGIAYLGLWKFGD